jgi:hypothetical protein
MTALDLGTAGPRTVRKVKDRVLVKPLKGGRLIVAIETICGERIGIELWPDDVQQLYERLCELQCC